VALRGLLRRAPEAAQPSPVQEPAAEPAWPIPAPAEPAATTAADWSTEPGFAAVAVEERPADEPVDWAAGAEPIDVNDHTVEMPALPLPPAPRRGRFVRAGLPLALVVACVGAALAASGALRSKKDAMPAPVRIGAASSIATKPAHHARTKASHAKRAHRHAARHQARRHRRAHRQVAVAPAHVVAAAPATPAAPRPAPVVQRVVSRPAPRPAPVSAPKRAPTPVATKPTTTASQPAPSAPSGEAGRQPPSTP
jgi:hypothetical protein